MAGTLANKIADLFKIDIKKVQAYVDALEFAEYMEAMIAVKNNNLGSLEKIFSNAGVNISEATVDLGGNATPSPKISDIPSDTEEETPDTPPKSTELEIDEKDMDRIKKLAGI